MVQVLLKSRFLTGTFLKGRQALEFLSESVTEIENLSVTITTSVDVAKISSELLILVSLLLSFRNQINTAR